MKITVYAIAKNEAKHVKRWMDSMKEADAVVVLDTGSTDGTPELLREAGAIVQVREITPWRFDVARNESMKLIPADTDIAVCTDLDEYFKPGWRQGLEYAWSKAAEGGAEPTTAKYEYVWNFEADGSDGAKFTYAKIHRPGVCRWTHPVHEILDYDVPEVDVFVPGMRLEHHADPTKSRGQYLELLAMSVKEDPDDDRNAHYYGRELMFHGRWQEAIAQLQRHLAMPKATWKAERAASMRYIANCLLRIGSENGERSAIEWFRAAIKEAPDRREAACELLELAYGKEDWPLVVEAGEAAVRVQERGGDYLSKARDWSGWPWDILALGYFYTGLPLQSVVCIRQAMRLYPNAEQERLEANLRLAQTCLPLR